MKKYIFTFIFLCSTLLFSCSKERRCRIINDCMGNDIGSLCGSEKKVQDYCGIMLLPGAPGAIGRNEAGSGSFE